MFNLKHGSNLGDRLIADCLERELRSLDPTIELIHADLAGRDRPSNGGRNRRLAFIILGLLPKRARDRVATAALHRLERRTLRPRWRRLLAGADAAVLGGGQLLADQDLNFPIKVSAALGEASAQQVPVAIYAVGVASGWSPRGTVLFGEALRAARLIFAAVRDRRSAAWWTEQLRDYRIGDPEIVVDPAMLTARHFPAPADRSEQAVTGVCITSPLALFYHGGSRETPRAIGDWYIRLAQELAQRGHHQLFFTTGSPEDETYLRKLAPRLIEATGKNASIAPLLSDAGELAALVAGCRLIVAHRLHACIPAAAYGIPFVGLSWDPKVEAFFDYLGFPERLISPARSTPSEAASVADHALAHGVPPERVLHFTQEAGANVARLFATLQKAAVGDGI